MIGSFIGMLMVGWWRWSMRYKKSRVCR